MSNDNERPRTISETTHAWLAEIRRKAALQPFVDPNKASLPVSKPTTVGRWTTEPPTVPGWYWWRDDVDEQPECVHVYSTRHSIRFWRERQIRSFGLSWGEWWTTPIQEPPR